MEKNYWVIQMGPQGMYAEIALEKGLIGIDWRELGIDFTEFVNKDRIDFKNVIAEKYSGSAGALGQTVGQIYRFVSLIKPGDIVLMKQSEKGVVHLGVVTSDYFYKENPGTDLPYNHQRTVDWKKVVAKSDLSQPLQNAVGSIMTLFSVDDYGEEIEELLFGKNIKTDETIDNKFGLEAHLEDFIVANWSLLKEFDSYKLYQEEGMVVGKQYKTNIGRLDILAYSELKKEWLIIELKKTKTSDDVVGQTLRYIGWVQKNLAEADQKVRGVIITPEEDEKLEYALMTVPHITFMKYQVSFKFI